MPVPTTEIGKRIAAQVQTESQNIDVLHESGDILNSNLIPDPPPEPKTEETAEAAPAPPAELDQHDLRRKYGEDWDKASNGYSHLLQSNLDLIKENEALKQRTVAQPGLPQAPVADAPQSPKAYPSAVNDFLKSDAVAKLAEQGLDAAPLAEFAQTVYQKAVEQAEQAIEERLMPIQNQAQAQATFNRLHPEAGQLDAELQVFIGTMPDRQKSLASKLMANGDVLEAMEYVYEKFSAGRQASVQTDLKAKAEAADNGRKAQRAQASLPQSSPTTPIHADDTPDPKIIAELAERTRGGDQEAHRLYTRLTFGRHLPQQMRTRER